MDVVKSRDGEAPPALVSERTKQAGEIRDRWSWVEPCVWTDRMLTALETGVKGGKWFSLIDKVSSRRNLKAAFARVKRNRGAAGIDHKTIEMYESHLDANLEKLSRELLEGTYTPQAILRRWIPKSSGGSLRPLGIPTVQDRVVQSALRQVLEPIYERDFAEQSYGFRPKRSCRDALRRVQELLTGGHGWVVEADFASYFDTMNHSRLLSQVEEKVSDGRVLDLLTRYLNQEVLESTGTWTPERGSPQGSVISPLLANIYLDPLDHLFAGTGAEMVRYADDLVILCRSQAEAEAALARLETWSMQAGLSLHGEKTGIVDTQGGDGFEFLGYRFQQGQRWPTDTSLGNLKDKIRRQTRRANGHSLERIISKLNPILRGWFEYFKHSGRATFPGLDGWTRMRLRSILRKRRGGRGRGRGQDHQRWPNAYFSEHGLYSLAAAWASARQSSRR